MARCADPEQFWASDCVVRVTVKISLLYIKIITLKTVGIVLSKPNCKKKKKKNFNAAKSYFCRVPHISDVRRAPCCSIMYPA